MFNPISFLAHRQIETPRIPETVEDLPGTGIYFKRGLDTLPGTILAWQVREDGWEGSSLENPIVRVLVASPAIKHGAVWVSEDDFVCYAWERQAVAS